MLSVAQRTQGLAGSVRLAGMRTPGVVIATDWHPDPDADDDPQPSALVVVARKP